MLLMMKDKKEEKREEEGKSVAKEPCFRTLPPREMTIFDDEDLELSCEVDSGLSFTGSWEKDGVILRDDGKVVRIRTRGRRLELRIRGSETICSGNYRVTIENAAGKIESATSVTVKERPPVQLAFSDEPDDVTVEEGSLAAAEVVLRCVLRESDPTAVAVWFFNSRPLNSREQDLKESFDGRLAELRLRNLRPEQSGAYSCGVKNSAHTCICMCRVSVRQPLEPPSFASRICDQNIRDGETLVLECALTSRQPNAKVTWFLNAEDISGSEGQRMEFNGLTARLIIWDAFEGDCGLYRCLVKTEVGECDCSARVRLAEGKPRIASPEFSEPLLDLRVQTGDSARLCAKLRTAVPGARLAWALDGSPLAAGVGVEAFDGHTASLVIGPLSPQQEGRYSLRVTSADGAKSAETTCRLQVEPAKVRRAAMSDGIDIETCEDEELLAKMLSKEDNMDKRRKLRMRLKEIRELEKKRLEERRKAREQAGAADSVKIRAQLADEEKARKLRSFSAQAKAGSTAPKTDAVKSMAERADADKAGRLKHFDDIAKTGGPIAFQGGLEAIKKLDQEHAEAGKQRALDSFSNQQKKQHASAKPEEALPRVQKAGGVGGISYGTRTEEAAKRLAEQLKMAATSGPDNGPIAGSVSVRTAAWNSREEGVRSAESSVSWGQKPPQRQAMNAFKAMDKSTNPEGPKKPNFLSNPGPARGGVTRNPSAIKQMLLEWCKAQVQGYEGVNVTNFGSSWADGLAFCALIHHFYPEAFDFSTLNAKNRRGNFQLAFDTAEKFADISPLLDVEDMVMMKVPDWKCVFTYVQSYYRKFRSHEKNVLRSQEPGHKAEE